MYITITRQANVILWISVYSPLELEQPGQNHKTNLWWTTVWVKWAFRTHTWCLTFIRMVVKWPVWFSGGSPTIFWTVNWLRKTNCICYKMRKQRTFKFWYSDFFLKKLSSYIVSAHQRIGQSRLCFSALLQYFLCHNWSAGCWWSFRWRHSMSTPKCSININATSCSQSTRV